MQGYKNMKPWQHRSIRGLGIVAMIATIAGCQEDGDEAPPVQTERGVIVQHLRGSQAAAGTYIGLDFLATDANGQPIPCDSADLTVDVEVAFADAPTQFVPVRDGTVRVRCVNDRSANIGMVVDNSGSQKSVIDLTKTGAKNFASEIMTDGGSISVTRVSTDSSVLTGLTDDAVTVQQELDGMFVNGGWTALYDGIRLGNETLGASLNASAAQPTYTDVDDFCDSSKRYGIVAFTNGYENNSAQQKLATPTNDGIDTSLDDLKQLSVDSVGTPLYIIGLGDEVNDAELQDLSDSTGGRYLQVATEQDIPAAYDFIADYQSASSKVCLEVGRRGCGQTTVRVSYSYATSQGTFEGAQDYPIYIPCEQEPQQGRVVTIVLALSDPGIDEGVATTLIRNSVNYTNPTNDIPRMLFVQDDNYRGEHLLERDFLANKLTDIGFDVTPLDEPAAGLTDADVAGFDVVWFTNPGWPWDDRSTYDVLTRFVAAGGGLVLSGDDISWSMGRNFPVTDLTLLDHQNNGTSTCGEKTDNNAGKSYEVKTTTSTHPVLDMIEGITLTYSNDIDHSSPAMRGEEVLAWATLENAPNCMVRTPVVLAYDPNTMPTP